MYKIKIVWVVLMLVSVTTLMSQSFIRQKVLVGPQKGVMDLRGWQFDKDGMVKLNGEWEFYWKSLYTPTDFERFDLTDKQYVQVPGYWNRMSHREEILTGFGYATYRLTLLVDDQPQEMALRTMAQVTSSKLWINGELKSVNGDVANRVEEAKPFYRPRVDHFVPKGERIEIVLQVSNFFHHKGGVWGNIQLGTKEQIDRTVRTKSIIDFVLIGVVLATAIYHFGLFFLRRKELSYLYFGFICLIIVLRVLTTGNHEISNLFPEIDWFLHIRVQYLVFHVGLPLLGLFIYELFPDEFHIGVVKSLVLVCSIFTIVGLLTPPVFFTQMITWFQVLIVLFCLYVVVVMSKVVRRRREGARLIAFGFFFFFLTWVNDIFYEQGVIWTLNLIPLGYLVSVFCQSFMLATRFSNALQTVEIQANELKAISENLERKVELRTEELRQKNETIQKRANDRKKFIHVLCHDLSNPIGGARSFLELMSDPDSEAEISDHKKELEKMMDQCLSSAIEIIDQTRESMVLEDYKASMNIERIHLNETIREALIHLDHIVRQKDISIQVDIPEYFVIEVDRICFMNSIFNNIITNAIKFSSRGGIIRIKSDHSDSEIRLIIQDFGIGMPSEIASTLFTPQEGTSRRGTEGETGTGFGMPLVKHFVEVFGGTIDVESFEGSEKSNSHGTTIFISFPFSPPSLSSQQS